MFTKIVECFTHYESLTIKHNTHTNRVKEKRVTKPEEHTSIPQHSEKVLLTQTFCNMISNLRPLEN